MITINFYGGYADALEIIFSGFTALGTIMATVVAFFAYQQSKKMRKNNMFNSLFTQLIGNHKAIFESEVLSRTKPVRTFGSYCIKEEENAFSNFYKYYAYRQNELKIISDLISLWDDYKMGIRDGVAFSHAFKYVYHEVTTVLRDDTIDERAKRHYVGIIQSLMNKDELFCYLVNLLQHSRSIPKRPTTANS
jgi:hypothetical protein